MNRSAYVTRLLTLFAVVTIVLKSCGAVFPRPFPCNKFLEFRWQQFQFGIDTPQDVIGTAMEL